MISRRAAVALGSAALAVCTTSYASAASADEITDSRYGITPYVGGGMAAFGHASPLPGVVGLSSLGAEIVGEVPPWGGFFRGEYLSSGQTGRWTALSFALGGSYRFFGEARHLSFLVRGGVSYQYWHASSSGCDVLIFVPNSCIVMTPPPMMGMVVATAPVTTDSGNAIGLYAGLRMELPVRQIYLAIDGSAMPDLAVGTAAPSAILGLKLDLVIGLRDVHKTSAGSDVAPPAPRQHHGI